MRRIPVAALAPLWLLCVGLHVQAVWQGRLAWFPLYAEPASGPQAPPRATGFWPGEVPPGTSVRPGDALLAAGDASLAGAGRLELLARAYPEARPDGTIPFRVERDGRVGPAQLALRPVAMPWRTVPLILGLGLTALIALWRSGGSPAARAYALAAFAYALHWSLFFGGSPWQTRLAFAVFVVGGTLAPPLLVRAALVVPDSLGPRAGTGRSWPWLLALNGLGLTSWTLGTPLPGSAGLRLVFVCNIASLGGTLVVLARNLRRADPVGRRQLKWILYGFAVGLGPVIVAAGMASVEPALWWLYEASLLATVLIPLCVLVAIVRFNFLDIDRLISATASYNLVLVGLVAAGLVTVPRAAAAASSLVGVDAETAQVVLSVALAAVLVPAQRRLRPWIERIFFSERHALEHGVTDLLAELPRADGPEKLLRLAGDRLDALLRPEGCAIYARNGDAFQPVFAHGRALPPALPATGSLLDALARSRRPLAAERYTEGRRAEHLSRFDRAALEALGVPVVVPLRREGALMGLLCLGPRRSGDVYTATDLTLLAAVGDRVSAELERFDREEVLRRSRSMQEALRRYVPGAVAEELASGGRLESSERELSILFVDIRRYSAYSEGRRAGEIFSTVNRYTRTVSEIIRRAGGSVVEFNGDGMMAVFGAPRALAAKERAAVEAALELVGAVEAMPVEGLGPGEGHLSVGVGIATGAAFVGNIQAADRLIWSAIGERTNLAARLQALTRDLDASVVLDAATWQAAGSLRERFEPRPGTPVRGLREPQDLYLVPLGTGAA